MAGDVTYRLEWKLAEHGANGNATARPPWLSGDRGPAKSWESEGVMPLGTGLTINLETTHQRLGKSVYETLWVEQYCFHPIATSVTSWFG